MSVTVYGTRVPREIPPAIRYALGIVGFIVGPFYAAGLHAVLAFLNRGKTFSVRPSASGKPVRVYRSARGIPKRYSAITSWNRIYTRPIVTIATMTHEMMHIEQVERWGFVGQAARYGYWHGRVGYNKNPLENEARAAAGQPTR